MAVIPEISDDLTAQQLGDLVRAAEERIAVLKDTEGPALIERCNRLAQNIGFRDLKDLLAKGGGKKKRGPGRPPKNSNGADHAQQ